MVRPRKEPGPFIITRHRLKRPDDPARPYVVQVHDQQGALICWTGPHDVRERDKAMKLFRNG